ncbi:MAG: acyl-CoA thioesterase [Deltaproteobacteria bacterium]|nr:MAG: acyl-CoA thioesterase [Deltaproteobacteria bacterium]
MSVPSDSAEVGQFTWRVEIRFGDCDPAGIIYYPRYFDLFHQAMESWFDGPLGLPYASLIRQHRLGLPSVRAEADYRAPSRFGEQVAVVLSIARLGSSSVHFDYQVRGPDGGLRVTGRTVCVVMDLDPSSETFQRAIPIPSDLRQRIQTFRRGSAAREGEP